MDKNRIYLTALLSIIAASSVIPAYAEVTSLKTGSSFYKGGSMIQFSGTTQSTDLASSGVTIVIFDPNNKFILLASGIPDSNHAFQVNVDTGLPSNKQLFSLKGMYNATAFIATQAYGKTVSFAFSPDGSSLTPPPPTNLTATSPSPTEIDISWLSPQNNVGLPITGYQIERNDGNGFNLIAHSQLTTYQDKGLSPYTEHAYRISTINSAGSSAPSNSVPIFTQQSITPTHPNTQNQSSSPTDQNSNQSLNDILQQRYAAAKKLQELLNAKTSNPTSTSPSSTSNPPQNSPQTIQLNENIVVGDKAANVESKKSPSMPENNMPLNNFANFDIKTIFYPIISLVGIGLVVAILYSRKKRKLGIVVKESQDAHLPVERTFEKQDDDYALAILKNRLAKGEITVDEFKILKDELSEP